MPLLQPMVAAFTLVFEVTRGCCTESPPIKSASSSALSEVGFYSSLTTFLMPSRYSCESEKTCS